MKRETLALVFSWEFCKIFKTTFFNSGGCFWKGSWQCYTNYTIKDYNIWCKNRMSFFKNYKNTEETQDWENKVKLKKLFNLLTRLRWGAQYPRNKEYTYFVISNYSDANDFLNWRSFLLYLWLRKFS